MSKFKYEGAGYYEMRNGGKAYVGYNATHTKMTHARPFVLVGHTEGDNLSWTIEGRWIDAEVEENFDLMRKWPEERTLWVNIYKNGYFGRTHNSKEEANRCATACRIACKKVTYTEGEFDE